MTYAAKTAEDNAGVSQPPRHVHKLVAEGEPSFRKLCCSLMQHKMWPGNAHVLVVEDEALIRMATIATLEELGFTILEAANAEEALSTLKANPQVQVLFTDINMPGQMDGLGLAHRVRRERPDVAIVISSGRALPDPPDLPEGALFLPKPYYQEDLVSIAKGVSYRATRWRFP